MLVIERLRSEVRSFPLLTRIGVAILVLGGLADVVAHLEAAGHADHLHDHTASELAAHLIVFVGMVVILLGVVLDGVRRTHRGQPGADTITPTRARPTLKP